MKKIFTIFFFLLLNQSIYAKAISIQFSIPQKKIIEKFTTKTQDFATVIPGVSKTYIFESEEDYYLDYQKSYYAVTKLKGGWDCMRHYEILANGCIPYFIDLDNCDSQTLFRFPRELVKKAMELPGVSLMRIDHSVFDKEKYFQIRQELIDYTKEQLTSESMAKYVLDKIGYKEGESILYLSGDLNPDYLRCLTFIGLKHVLFDKVIDFPVIDHLYSSSNCDQKKLYGKGFSYSKILEYSPIKKSTSQIIKELKKKTYDFVIYGSIHRGLPFHNLIKKLYPQEKIFYLCGEDIHHCEFKNSKNLFLREFTYNN